MDSKLLAVILILVVAVSVVVSLIFLEQSRYEKYQSYLKCHGFFEGIGCWASGHKTEASIMTGAGTWAACKAATFFDPTIFLSAVGCAVPAFLVGSGTYLAAGGSIGEALGNIVLPLIVAALFGAVGGILAFGFTKIPMISGLVALIFAVIGFMFASWLVTNWLLLLFIGLIVAGIIVYFKMRE